MSRNGLKAVLGMAVLGAAGHAHATDATSLEQALTGGKVNVQLRVRYEDVELDPVFGTITEDSADTLNSRLQLTYTTGAYKGFDAKLGFENVAELSGSDYNSTANNKTQYPVIADPKGSEVNEAWLRFSGLPNTQLKLGRQVIVLDNARFVGDVGWRQNQQTYDGISLLGNWLPKLKVNYDYLSNVNSFRVWNIDGVNTDDIDLKAHLFNVSYAPFSALTVTPYYYLLDFDYDSLARVDSKTLGARLTGSQPFGKVKFSYAVEYATQSDYQDSDSTVDADYTLVEIGAALPKVGAKLGYEVLGGDGVYGFQTPLATLHAFQGWADLFLATPATGIRDKYLSLSGTIEKFALLGVYHVFEADEGSADYGKELDLQVTRPLTKTLTAGIKYAAYQGDDSAPAANFAADTTKYWAWVEYKF